MRFSDLMTFLVLGLVLEGVAGLLLALDDSLFGIAVVLGSIGGIVLSIGVLSVSFLFALRVHEIDQEVKAGR